jgi:hypothetical protein
MTDQQHLNGTGVSCAVLHTDGKGNIVPCPGYPHAEPQPDEFGLTHCPHCTDAVVDLGEHLKTCTALREEQLAEARRLVAEHEQARLQACSDEIQAVLDRYGMRLTAAPVQITLTPVS